MNWEEIRQRIQAEIVPHQSAILKLDGVERRKVTSNNGHKIGLRTGVNTNQSKAITYEMIKFAYEILLQKGHFDSRDFHTRYQNEYEAGPCRFSMTGGILVELGLADIVPNEDETTSFYVKKA